MAFEAIKKQELFPSIAEVPARKVEEDARRDRYDLAAALSIVRQMETSASRGAVFEEIKSKNRLYRLVDWLYSRAGHLKAGSRILQPLLLLAYMMKCVITLGPFGQQDAKLIAISNFANEHHTIRRVAALIPDVPLLHLTSQMTNIFDRSQLLFAIRMVGSARRIFPFLRILARTHSFMPSARIASALAFYMRFSRILKENQVLNAAIIASNYSPESLGMAAAAHRMGRRVIYANHAPVPANGAVVPPVLADCALFYGEATTKTYQDRSRCIAEIALIGQPGLTRQMEWRDKVSTIGIFLTAGTRPDILKSLIATIRLSMPAVRIIIRQHPVTLLRTDFSGIGVKDMNTELTFGNPLDAEIAACDLVICGNSGVSMNVVSGGRPVAYLSSLDTLPFDANGFVQNRLVYSMPWWTDDLYDRLAAFYKTPGWKAVMQQYDASYGEDASSLEQTAAKKLRRVLSL